MAQFQTPLHSIRQQMQAGERRFAQRLEKLLEDDYLCWYDLPVGKRQRYADFVIVHPLRGVLLLEVKDWKLESIKDFSKKEVQLLTSSGLKTVLNPLEQARQCAYQLVQQLETDAQLVQLAGKYQGKLAFPYGFGVVLTHITREQFDRAELGNVLPATKVICKDEMLESTDAEDFQQCLWNMFEYQFSQPLSLPQIDRIRWHLFPEIRITTQQADLFANPAEATQETPATYAVLPDLLKVMDQQQEQLARSLGTGHRVIHGVAGSGKTLILGFRCLYLAQLLHKPILVLCYNITLAAKLRDLMQAKGIQDRVNVYHFHDWCGELLRHYHVAKPAFDKATYFEDLVEAVIAAVANGEIPRGQYGAIMIDEGHDFKPDWLKLISGMVDPDTDSLLLLYDDAQSIYSANKQLDFSLSSVGINARGRTTVLKLNYRNTHEVFQFADRFARHYLQIHDSDEDHIPILSAESVGRSGAVPQLKRSDSYAQEVAKIVKWLTQWQQQAQLSWRDVCILYRYAAQGKQLHDALKTAAIPLQWLGSAARKKQFKPEEDCVKLMTLHSSKGLEFPWVIISGLGFMPDAKEDTSVEAKLLYVAMTRSTDKLLLMYHQETEFTQCLSG